jgi:FlaG/FlaF family flagellin (archaellin)
MSVSVRASKLLGDDAAVSPVIGVVLMVVVTVLLATVTGAFVLGLGGQLSSPPQASFEFTYDEGAGEVTVSHFGGDSIDADSLTVKSSEGFSGTPWGSEVTAGSSATLADADGSGTAYDGDEVLYVVWTGSNGDTYVLGKWTGPDA